MKSKSATATIITFPEVTWLANEMVGVAVVQPIHPLLFCWMSGEEAEALGKVENRGASPSNEEIESKIITGITDFFLIEEESSFDIMELRMPMF